MQVADMFVVSCFATQGPAPEQHLSAGLPLATPLRGIVREDTLHSLLRHAAARAGATMRQGASGSSVTSYRGWCGDVHH
jgi:hypothetical protein